MNAEKHESEDDEPAGKTRPRLKEPPERGGQQDGDRNQRQNPITDAEEVVEFGQGGGTGENGEEPEDDVKVGATTGGVEVEPYGSDRNGAEEKKKDDTDEQKRSHMRRERKGGFAQLVGD